MPGENECYYLILTFQLFISWCPMEPRREKGEICSISNFLGSPTILVFFGRATILKKIVFQDCIILSCLPCVKPDFDSLLCPICILRFGTLEVSAEALIHLNTSTRTYECVCGCRGGVCLKYMFEWVNLCFSPNFCLDGKSKNGFLAIFASYSFTRLNYGHIWSWRVENKITYPFTKKSISSNPLWYAK